MAKTCLAKITNHANRAGSHDVTDSLISFFVLFKTLLWAQKPRSVTLAMSQTWVVFTDASYEQTQSGEATAGFGGVLLSAVKRPIFFSFELSGKDVDKLNPSGKKTVIFQCELFAVLVALSVWRDQLSSRQVVFYIDNDGVRDVLISSDTSDPIGHVMLTRVLELEGALAIFSWFTRVPSRSNIADGPSRGECKELIAAKAIKTGSS